MQTIVLLLAILLPLLCLGATLMNEEGVMPRTFVKNEEMVRGLGQRMRKTHEPEIDELRQILEIHLKNDEEQKTDIYQRMEWNQRELVESIRELNNKLGDVVQNTSLIWLNIVFSFVNILLFISQIKRFF